MRNNKIESGNDNTYNFIKPDNDSQYTETIVYRNGDFYTERNSKGPTDEE